MKMLLDNVSLPLQNGSTERFDCMMKILMHCGVEKTKMIGFSMNNEVQGTHYNVSLKNLAFIVMYM